MRAAINMVNRLPNLSEAHPNTMQPVFKKQSLQVELPIVFKKEKQSIFCDFFYLQKRHPCNSPVRKRAMVADHRLGSTGKKILKKKMFKNRFAISLSKKVSILHHSQWCLNLHFYYRCMLGMRLWYLHNCQVDLSMLN